ncbi:MAG: folate-binding protein YgfZ [Propionivibrio sp.]
MMNANWHEFLGANGARIDNGLVADFGDLPAELASARDATVVAPLVHLALLECSGEDAKSFLHNQLTSDVNHLAPDTAQHAAWCTAKGRMQASFLHYRTGGTYRLLLSADLLAATQKRLQMFVLRSKVKIADLTGDNEFIGLSGPNAEAALTGAGLPVPGTLLASATFGDGTIIRLDASRFVLVCSSTSAPELWRRLLTLAKPAGTPVWRWLDVNAGIPLITEATKEAFVPQMADFDKIGGVSFHKGCYPGQEIVARTQYLGKVKRHLYRIHSDAPVAAGISIYAPDSPEHPCGMIANAAPSPDGGYDALAVIQENFVELPGLSLGESGGRGFSIAGNAHSSVISTGV